MDLFLSNWRVNSNESLSIHSVFFCALLAKSGMLASEVLGVAQHVISTCPHLKLAGLMTIGSPSPDLENGDNPDFKVRRDVPAVRWILPSY